MIKPLSNMEVHKPSCTPEPEDYVDLSSGAEPIVETYVSESDEVRSVGAGEVVAAFEDTVIIFTTIYTIHRAPAGFRIPKNAVYDDDGSITSCDWIVPGDIVEHKQFYLTYANIVSELMIGDLVDEGEVIGSAIENKINL